MSSFIRIVSISILVVFVGILSISCSTTATDQGEYVTKSYDFEFSELKISGSYEVFLTQNEQYSVEISTYSKFLEKNPPKVKNSALVITNEGNHESGSLKRSVVRISMPQLNKLDIDGAMTIHGSQLSGDSLHIDMDGANEVTLEGEGFNNIIVREDGASHLDLSELPTVNADIKGYGATNFYLTMNGGILKVDFGGISIVEYQGETSEVITSIEGLSRVIKVETFSNTAEN